MNLKFKIIDPIGMHARPASVVVSVASKFKSDIKIITNNKEGNLKSVMSVMAMGIKKNDLIEIVIKGSDEKEAAEKIESTMRKNNLI